MKRILCYLLIVVLAVLSTGARLEAQVGGPDLQRYELKEAFKEIAKERDEVSWFWPYLLACRGNEDDFSTFKKAMRLLKETSVIEQSYSWLSAHHDAPSRDAALEFLEKEALRAPRLPLRVAAAKACNFFREVEPLLERLLTGSKDSEVRTVVITPLLSEIAARGDLESLVTILNNANPENQEQGPAISRALARFSGVEVVEELKGRLVSHKAPDAWRVILMDRLRDEPGEDVTGMMVDLLRRKKPGIQILALEILEKRGRAAFLRKDVLGLIESKDDALCFAAIATAGRTLTGDPRWATKLFRLAEHRDAVRRTAAAGALADLRTPEAIELLYSMLGDEDWRVRVAVMRASASLRRKDSLPNLMTRLDLETGRVHWELINTLEYLTGMKLGRQAGRWKRWWEAEGETFTLPTVREVEAKLAAFAKHKEELRTVATFYGIPVLSERVCFVLDVSGSMMEPAVVEGRTRTEESGPTRLDVAKEQLTRMLKALSDDRRCNIVFFSSDVHAWQDEVVPLEKRMREDALRFVARQRAMGATNLYDAVALAFDDPLVDTVYVLSDGQPNAGSVVGTEPIRRAVKRINSFRGIQVHCIAIGDDSEVMRLLAEDSGGVYRNVGKPPKPEEEE